MAQCLLGPYWLCIFISVTSINIFTCFAKLKYRLLSCIFLLLLNCRRKNLVISVELKHWPALRFANSFGLVNYGLGSTRVPQASYKTSSLEAPGPLQALLLYLPVIITDIIISLSNLTILSTKLSITVVMAAIKTYEHFALHYQLCDEWLSLSCHLQTVIGLRLLGL